MKPGYILTIILATVLILSFAIVLLDKDVLQKEPPTWVPPSYLSIREVDVKPVEVTSARIEVNVTAYINHKGGKSQNATMFIRAINSDTRLLETQVPPPYRNRFRIRKDAFCFHEPRCGEKWRV